MRQKKILSYLHNARWQRNLNLFFLCFLICFSAHTSWYDSFKSVLSSPGSTLGNIAAGAATGAIVAIGTGGGTNNSLPGTSSLLAQCRMLASTPGGMYSPQYQMNCQNASLMCMQALSGVNAPQLDPYCATVMGYGVNTVGPWGGGFTSMPSGGPVPPGGQMTSNATSETLGWSVPVPPLYFTSAGSIPTSPPSLGGAASSGFLSGFFDSGNTNSLSGIGSGLLGGLKGAATNSLSYYSNPYGSGGYPSLGGYGY